MDRAIERSVRRRAAGRCEYCRMSQADDELPFEVDHIIAEQHDGRTQEGNLCLACFSCTRHKGPNIAGVDPETGNIVPLFNPRRQKWPRHFRWDGPVLTGRTASGRATIVVLKINLDYRIDLRRALIEEGGFPPP
ncbi:HNH endonuclease [Paludisphaera mucosa]|uniref:HNH endonuclease signature motif containing protein n=1 Tax=Paludisphaera mucosa TaxID=3030827 RepID=A0ABT6F441_9BACT|nr:HNH endonuclease signature motif containing protein [Paludisphaera mucosa]MDG3002358.1 HNH endonuclease signature motif containing protein [Paludisphaera mucosa]